MKWMLCLLLTKSIFVCTSATRSVTSRYREYRRPPVTVSHCRPPPQLHRPHPPGFRRPTRLSRRVLRSDGTSTNRDSSPSSSPATSPSCTSLRAGTFCGEPPGARFFVFERGNGWGFAGWRRIGWVGRLSKGARDSALFTRINQLFFRWGSIIGPYLEEDFEHLLERHSAALWATFPPKSRYFGYFTFNLVASITTWNYQHWMSDSTGMMVYSDKILRWGPAMRLILSTSRAHRDALLGSCCQWRSRGLLPNYDWQNSASSGARQSSAAPPPSNSAKGGANSYLIASCGPLRRAAAAAVIGDWNAYL